MLKRISGRLRSIMLFISGIIFRTCSQLLHRSIRLLNYYTSLGYRDLQRLHVFGCPVYVLDPKMQDGKKLPKWQRRSRCAVYLGTSQNHGSTVALVLNLETGKFSPQYHLIIFNDDFSTIHSNGQFDQDVWHSLITSNPYSNDPRHEHHVNDGTPTIHSSTDFDSPSSADVDADVQRLFDSVNQPAGPTDNIALDFPSAPLPNLPSVPEGVSSGTEGVYCTIISPSLFIRGSDNRY